MKTFLSFMRTYPAVWLITAIIIAGLAPRSVELISGNYLFGYDQGLFFEKVKRIAAEGNLTLIGEEVGGRGGFFQGPGFYYLLSVPFFLTGGDPYASVILMFLTGAATLILTAFVVWKSFGAAEAVAVTFLAAVSPAMVSQSRFLWNPFFVPVISVAILGFLYAVLSRKKFALPALFFAIGLLFHFEIATGIMTCILYMIFLPYLWIRRFVRGRDIAAAALAFGSTQLNFLIFDLRNNFLITRGILRTATGEYPHAITQTYVEHMLANHWQVFWSQFTSTFAYSRVVWPAMAVLAVLGVIHILRDRKAGHAYKTFSMFLLFAPPAMFALYMKYLWPMWEWWILELGVVYVFLFGIISARLWRAGGLWRAIIVIWFSGLAYFHVSDTVRFFRTDFADYGGTHKIRGKIDAIDALYRDAAGAPFNLLVFSPPVYTYPYDYLLWWHGKKTYGYLPGKEKSGDLYLLIEPDPHKPWSHTGWLETVVRDGTVEKEWSLPSGFIIQKRKVAQ